MTENKGAGRPDMQFEVKNSQAPFEVREADEVEAKEAEIKRQADIDRRIERLQGAP